MVTCSDFFKALLGDVPCQHPIVYLRGINGPEMEALIDFMYLGKVDVPQKDMSKLLSTAEVLQIKDLGVINPCIKDEAGYTSSKRKHSSSLGLEEDSSSEVVTYKVAKKFSSPKHRNEAQDKMKMNTHFSNGDDAFSSDKHHENRDKFNSICHKNMRDEVPCDSFKSSPITSSTSSISNELDGTSYTEPKNYIMLPNKNSEEEKHLTSLTPLRPYIPDGKSDYSMNSLGGVYESKMTTTSYFSEGLNKMHSFENLVSIFKYFRIVSDFIFSLE